MYLLSLQVERFLDGFGTASLKEYPADPLFRLPRLTGLLGSVYN